MTELLQIENLSCGYAAKFNISGISFNLNRGQFAGIIGPNGSGKSTLFRGITSIIPVKEGFAKLDGKKIHKMGSQERARKIAMVHQYPDTIPITVEEYILMGRIPYHGLLTFFESKEDYDIAEYYMNITDTLHLKDKLLSNLSGGEQQMVSIARALVQQPTLLLLDEPTSHLDITHQYQVLNLIQKLNSDLGLTVLMIVHDLNIAGEYCDFLVLLNNGKIHSQGSPETVLHYENIESVYKTVVISQTNPLSGKPVVFPVSGKVLNKLKDAKDQPL